MDRQALRRHREWIEAALRAERAFVGRLPGARERGRLLQGLRTRSRAYLEQEGESVPIHRPPAQSA